MLAYSTASHLGFMFVAFGLQLRAHAFLLLLAHAFFKALLFLIAGVWGQKSTTTRRKPPPLPQRHAWSERGFLFVTWAVGLLCMLDFVALKKAIVEASLTTIREYGYGTWVAFALLFGALMATVAYVILLLRRIQQAATEQRTASVLSVRGPIGLGIGGLAVLCIGVQVVLLLSKQPLMNWLVGIPTSRTIGWFAPAAISIGSWLLGILIAAWLLRRLRQGKVFGVDGMDPWDFGLRVIILHPCALLAKTVTEANRWLVDGSVRGIGRLILLCGWCGARSQNGQLQRYLLLSVIVVAISVASLMWVR